jgi:hypothetical protein
MTSPIDENSLEHQILGTFGDRLARLETQSARAQVHAEVAEKERTRQGQEMADLRNEMKTGFEDLRNDLRPLVNMAGAGRLVFWGFILCIPVLVGMTQLFDRAWTFITNR